MPKKKRNTNILFYLLVSYILVQFVWWEVLLVKQTRQIHDGKEKLLALGVSDSVQLQKELSELKKKENNYIYMIIGEGTIFLIFITIGIIRVYNAHKREKEISSQQKNFLLSVSHELKTPLATSKLNLQTLLKHNLPKETQVEMLEKTLYENERLTQLIENILISTRLDDAGNANSILVNKEEVNISELTQTTIQKAFTSEQQKRITTKIENNILLNTDTAIFPSIIINLVENALKYTPDNCPVVVELSKTDKIILKVSDEGLGISTEEKPKVFDKFFRSGNEETRKSKGTGLGLFIVKKMVEMHNGTISVYDNKPKGSVFEVKI
ncbi:MAG: two-component sensor histidine kinase [Bacteroidetes bacterium]|nr:two-component sensor histidine kinase [Bacteroidota bacterium]